MYSSHLEWVKWMIQAYANNNKVEDTKPHGAGL